MPKKGILIAFGELFLKSPGVQRIFRKRLLNNLIFFLKKEKASFKIHNLRERMLIETNDISKAKRVAARTFGIAWFSECWFFTNIELKDISDFVADNYKSWIKKGESFAIRLKGTKGAKESREEIISKIAENIARPVNLSRPKKEIFIEARKKDWFLYFKKQKGLGGLPVGAGGKVLSLMSGGIDSPVASFLIAKRGAENVWLHFHSFPLVSRASIEKTEELAKIFLKYQPHLKIYFAPFRRAQTEIKTKTPSRYRILLYRRLMFRMAERIAKKEDCKALVTGESLGQVSSQTLSNLNIIENSVRIPILRPLIGMDKEEIIKLAKKIKSYKISIKPQEDCCTLFVPKKQTAEGDLREIKKLEEQLDVTKIINQIVKETEVKNY